MVSVPLDTAALYDEHVDFVWRLLTRLGVHRDAVEDATQEVFLIVHRRRAEFRSASSVRTWLGGIAVHVAKDHRRSANRHARRVELADRETRRDVKSPHESAESSQALTLALQLLEALDEDQRTVFVLAEFEELTAQEIAEMTNTNSNTVSSRLRLARKHFNELVIAYRREEVPHE
ncbi:MAG: RNA polymerase sigma factor [Archangium sp.]